MAGTGRTLMVNKRLTLALALCLTLLGALPGAEGAARPSTVDLRKGSGVLGKLPLVVLEDGSVYVDAERLAGALGGAWIVNGPRGSLAVGSRAAHFTRSAAAVVLPGARITLDVPVRQTGSGWLIPEDFLARGLARIAPDVKVTRPQIGLPPPSVRPAAKPAPRPVEEPARGQEATVEDLRLRSYPSFTRVVVEADGPVTYAVEADRKAIRVKLAGLAVSGPQREEVEDGLVKEVRLDPARGGDAVLLVTLEGAAGQVKDFSLQDPFRIVLDIFRPRETPGAQAGKGAIDPLRLIVLDAGHGGHDPGAIGPTGLQEKEVVLDVTRRVARMLEDSLGIKVVFTRNSDVFVPLRDRTTFANKQQADLFVSIHANAHPRSLSQGVETYFLSSEASDIEARQVAAIENGVVKLEAPTTQRKTNALKSILWDLAQSEFQQESSFLAETVLDSMTRSLGLVNRGIKQAGFYVLGGAAMPAILIEIGFLTNPKEERKLRSPEHREAAARAIYAGLAEYKRRYDQRARTAQARSGPVEPATR